MISSIAFTKKGQHLGEKIEINIAEPFNFHRCMSGELSAWTSKNFYTSKALIFIGATGIAVRAIAAHIKSKTSDPAVIVIDELGKYVIPILSGHLGGANELSLQIADIIGATPIITTATDLENVFAIDNWAKENGYSILNPHLIKKISSRLLENRQITYYSENKISDLDNVDILYTKDKNTADLLISPYLNNNPNSLHIVPPVFALGVGCKKGTNYEIIEKTYTEFLESHNISDKSVFGVATIDLKKNESGLLTFCKNNNFSLTCYSSSQLNELTGKFTESEFVKKITGVDNICERSAVLKSNKGKLIINKTKFKGITFALAERKSEEK